MGFKPRQGTLTRKRIAQDVRGQRRSFVVRNKETGKFKSDPHWPADGPLEDANIWRNLDLIKQFLIAPYEVVTIQLTLEVVP